MVDLFTETIEATADYSITNQEDDMSSCCSAQCCETSCPEAVSDITINQTVLNLADGEAQVVNEPFTGETGLTITLGNTPVTGFIPVVTRNGVMQKATRDYSISGTTVTFVETLVADDTVIVRYAYEVT